MKKIGSAYENFAFKAFDFSGRASLVEYWAVMPVIWAAIIFLTIGDLQEAWGMLLERRVPPANPLYWDGLLVFVLTIIPRLSLTVRRLHDGGKSGKWAKLPFITVISGFWLLVGFGAAIITTTDAGNTLAMGMVLMAIFLGERGADVGVWNAVFAAAQSINAIGFEVIWQTLADMLASTPKPDVRAGISNINNELQSDPFGNGQMMLVMVVFIATPFVTAMLHLFFMMNPGLPADERPGEHKIAGATLRRQGDVSDNPFAGYKYLQERSPEQKAAQKIAAKEEIRSLYQQRVLGRKEAT